jgi:hypothetical protein
MLLCLLASAGCVAPPEPHDPPGDAPAPEPAPPPPPRRFAAVSADGELVLADGASGGVVERAAATGPIVDLAWDPWALRLIAVEVDPEGEGGEITAHTLPLGAGEHVAWLDGQLRVLPAPPGLVVFEQSYGERWRLIGAAPTSSLAAPPPSAAWIGPGPSLFAVAGGALREVPLSAAGLGTPTITPLPDGVVVPRDGGALAVEVPLPAPGLRAVAAAAVGDHVAVLTASPPTLVVAALSAGGAVTATAHLPLPGLVADPAPFFSRYLCALGDHLVLAATTAGVFAVRIGSAPHGITLELAPGFDGSALRGPLAPSP